MSISIHKAILLLQKIPKGKVVSYKELAHATGTSPRAVGSILSCNKDPKTYPCYKVVKTNGELGGYSGPGGVGGKLRLLKKDGIVFEHGKIPSHFFYSFSN